MFDFRMSKCMVPLILLALLNSSAVLNSESFINPFECGRRINEIRGERLDKIVGAQRAHPEDWGWHILLEFYGLSYCGGSLINKEWVITAARCVYFYNPSDFKVRLGLHDRYNPENYSITRNVSEFIIHPQYKVYSFQNDIALLKLDSPVEYTDQVLPICLPTSDLYLSDQSSWETGWGILIQSFFQILPSQYLIEIETKILNKSMCEKRNDFLDPPIFDWSVNICSENNFSYFQNIYYVGDPGGPIVSKVGEKWYLAGIKSWGSSESLKPSYEAHFFARTTFYFDWILENIKKKNQTVTELSTTMSTTISTNLPDSSNNKTYECGQRIHEIKGGHVNKIVGGQRAHPQDWGWQILLEHFGIFRCGGSLINTEWVVTAAHCVDIFSNSSDYTVRLGLHDRYNPESYSISRRVNQFIVHPEYNPDNFHNDIALLKLESPVEYMDHILPICLPTSDHDFSDQTSWATGWGRLSAIFFNSPAQYLMEMETNIHNKSVCEKRYDYLDPPIFNWSINICAGGNGKSVCFGDSGGPIVAKVGEKWFLAGISSWVLVNSSVTISCYDGGVFTRTSFYVDWILSKTSASSSILKENSALKFIIIVLIKFTNFI